MLALTKSLARLELMLKTGLDTDPGLKLCKAAEKWLGKGSYVEEDSNSVLVSNYPSDPAYLINDFMILYSICPQNTRFPNTLEYMRLLAQDRLSNKSLHMNCWQFVLLCMHASGMLDMHHILQMYQAQSTLPTEQRRIPNLMVCSGHRSYNVATNIGDIIFFTRDSELIWHIGIVYRHEEKLGYIHCLGIDVSFSEFSEYDKPFFCLSPRDVIQSIVNSTDGVRAVDLSFMSDIDPDEMMSALFCKDGEMYQEYINELERRWSEYTHTEEYLTYEPDQDFVSLLQLMGRGDAYNKKSTSEHQKRKYLDQISSSVKQHILLRHGLGELAQ